MNETEEIPMKEWPCPLCPKVVHIMTVRNRHHSMRLEIRSRIFQHLAINHVSMSLRERALMANAAVEVIS